MYTTLENRNNSMTTSLAIVATFFVVALMCVIGSVFAEGNFIDTGANSLLKSMGTIIALCGIGAGIFQVIKGRTVMGIVIAVVAGIMYAMCQSPALFGTIGQSILGIFGLH